jgi:hypothetical protein
VQLLGAGGKIKDKGKGKIRNDISREWRRLRKLHDARLAGCKWPIYPATSSTRSPLSGNGTRDISLEDMKQLHKFLDSVLAQLRERHLASSSDTKEYSLSGLRQQLPHIKRIWTPISRWRSLRDAREYNEDHSPRFTSWDAGRSTQSILEYGLQGYKVAMEHARSYF